MPPLYPSRSCWLLVQQLLLLLTERRRFAAGFAIKSSAGMSSSSYKEDIASRFCSKNTVFSGSRISSESVVCRHQAASDDGEAGEDLFDYFDPLLSPHAYPNGISPEEKPFAPTAQQQDNTKPPTLPPAVVRLEQQQQEESDAADRDPLRLSSRVGFLKANEPAERVELPPGDIDTDYVFDPTLSPHVYANGTPSTIKGDDEASNYVIGGGDGSSSSSSSRSTTVGILLMDHGSRNAGSNERLHEMARIYERSIRASSPSAQQRQRVIVRAAHMEIATPTIQDGIESLLEAGVDEIVCHPFFLSPKGRHVSEDIPRIVGQVVEELDIDIPILTTDPIGMNMDVMINAIHAMVKDTSNLLNESSQPKKQQVGRRK